MQLIRNRSRDQVHRNGVLLARLASRLDMPVELTSSLEDQFQGPLIPELEKILPAEYAKRSQRIGVVDASGSNTAVSEEIALQTMLHAGVRLTTIPQLMSELAQDWTSPAGAEVMDLLNNGWQATVADKSFTYQ